LKDFLEFGSTGREAAGGSVISSGGDDGFRGCRGGDGGGGGSFETTISDAGEAMESRSLFVLFNLRYIYVLQIMKIINPKFMAGKSQSLRPLHTHESS
jgi:hypothetical protein